MRFHSIVKLTYLFVWVLTGFCSSAFASHEVTFSWHACQSTVLQGYRIYIGTSSGNYDQVADVGDPGEIDGIVMATVIDLDDYTTYYFAVTAYGDEDLESGYSQEVVWDPAVVDGDHDGLVHLVEMNLGTDPVNPDTDGDGYEDGQDGYPLDYSQAVCAYPVLHADAGTFYGSVGSVYDSGVLYEGDTLFLSLNSHSEELLLDQPITVTLAGGYDCSFTTNYSNTVIHGSVTITDGALVADRLIIQ